MKDQRKAMPRIWGLAILLVMLFFLSFLLGRFPISPKEAAGILAWRCGLPVTVSWTDQMAAAVLNIRLPRILLAMLVGGALSAAGMTYQNVFQNPMASPDILGASSGACFGATLAILLEIPAVTAMAFACSLATVVMVYFVGRRGRGSRTMNLLLAGIMVSSLFSAGISCIKLVADPNSKLPEITYWLMGSLSGAAGEDVSFILLPLLAGLLPLLALRWQLNLLTLGEEEAASMGVDTKRLRLLVILCATLLTAASVSASGMIGWIGLVIPHLSRRLVGNDCRYLLPASILFGALFMLLVDDISRTLLAIEIPIGILLAFVGAPFFLHLMTRKGGWA